MERCSTSNVVYSHNCTLTISNWTKKIQTVLISMTIIGTRNIKVTTKDPIEYRIMGYFRRSLLFELFKELSFYKNLTLQI